MAVVVAATATATATAEQRWAHSGRRPVLRSMGAKMDPLTGVSATASEATLCSVLAGVDTHRAAAADHGLCTGRVR